MNLQEFANKIISILSPSKLAKYIAEILEKNNSLEVELKSAKEQVKKYKDEVHKLKGEKGRPTFPKKPPKGNKHLPKNKKELGEAGDRKNNKKSNKLEKLKIKKEKVVTDSRIKRKKGYKDVTIQDLLITNNTIKYKLECGYDEHGNFITAELPVQTHGEFGVGVLTLVKMLYYQCRVPMDKIHTTLKGFGIIIGKSSVVKMCHFLDDKRKKELDYARGTSIRKNKVAQMDDTGAIVDNKNQHTFALTTKHVTVLTTIDSKSKMSALYAYTGGQRLFYVLNHHFFNYLGKSKYRDTLLKHRRKKPYSEDEFNKILNPLMRSKTFHSQHRIRVCAIRAWIDTHPPNIPHAILLTDDAGNFKFMGEHHQLCWVHELRHYRKLEALTEVHKELKEKILAILYDFYKNLKLFKNGEISRSKIEQDFDFIISIKTGFEALDTLLSHTKKRRKGLLMVLKYPFVPLHNNLCEQDLRESVIKRKVSGGTKTQVGTYSWDVGLSLVHTCRKLKISFYDYLKDRYSMAYKIPRFDRIIQQMA